MKIALQTKILERFLSKKALEDLISEYNDNRERNAYEKAPSKLDFEIYEDYKKGLLEGEIAQRRGLHYHTVRNGIRRVAVSMLR